MANEKSCDSGICKKVRSPSHNFSTSNEKKTAKKVTTLKRAEAFAVALCGRAVGEEPVAVLSLLYGLKHACKAELTYLSRTFFRVTILSTTVDIYFKL